MTFGKIIATYGASYSSECECRTCQTRFYKSIIPDLFIFDEDDINILLSQTDENVGFDCLLLIDTHQQPMFCNNNSSRRIWIMENEDDPYEYVSTPSALKDIYRVSIVQENFARTQTRNNVYIQGT